MNSISDTRNPTSSMLNVLYKDVKCVGGFFFFFFMGEWEVIGSNYSTNLSNLNM